MSVTKDRSPMWKRLLQTVERYQLLQRIAATAYGVYENPKNRRAFYSRIKAIRREEYLDISSEPSLNVILLVVDCLRNSRLSCQGYSRETTPFLDSFETRLRAISASSWTYSSVASILTGLYPHNHEAILTGRLKNSDKIRNFRKLRSDILTLPEMLFLLGYKTYFGTAIDVAFYPLRQRVIPDRYDPSTKADDLLNTLTKWISKKRGKFFAYVQLGDLHQPLNPPDNFRHFFGDVKNLPNVDMWDFRRPEERKAAPDKFRAYRDNRELLYDNTLRYADNAIERFYKGIKNMGIVDSTILVVTADHGEEFWEHAQLEAESFYDPRGYYGVGHGHNVFNEIIEVPLLMSGPIPVRKPAHFVSTVDILPTVVDLLGINHNMNFDGQNVFDNKQEIPLISEASGYGYQKYALIAGRYKLIYSEGDGVQWLFDLEKDPNEQHPIVDGEVTSIFVKKLLRMLREGQKMKIREIARKKSLSRPSNI